MPVSDEVTHFIERHQRVYVVEQNRDAQVTSLLKSTLSGALADRLVPITHYNGTPIAAENIVRPILGWEKNPSGPGWPTGNVERDNPPVPPRRDRRSRPNERGRCGSQSDSRCIDRRSANIIPHSLVDFIEAI